LTVRSHNSGMPYVAWADGPRRAQVAAVLDFPTRLAGTVGRPQRRVTPARRNLTVVGDPTRTAPTVAANIDAADVTPDEWSAARLLVVLERHTTRMRRAAHDTVALAATLAEHGDILDTVLAPQVAA
jgi:hypothetical protein